MNFYKLFYWITIAEKVQNFTLAIAIAATVVMAIGIIACFGQRMITAGDNGGVENDKTKMFMGAFMRMWKIPLPIFITCWLLYILIPSKSDTVLIIAGGAVGNFVTSDSSTRALPSELTLFLRTKIQELTHDAKEDMGILDSKGQKLNELKELTKEQIIERLKKDTTYR